MVDAALEELRGRCTHVVHGGIRRTIDPRGGRLGRCFTDEVQKRFGLGGVLWGKIGLVCRSFTCASSFSVCSSAFLVGTLCILSDGQHTTNIRVMPLQDVSIMACPSVLLNTNISNSVISY